MRYMIMLLLVIETIWSQDTTGFGAFLHAVNQPLCYTLPNDDDLVILRDVVYKSTPSGPLKADVYRPKKTAHDLPIIILIHGGVGNDIPLRPKEWGGFVTRSKAMAVQGFLVVMFNTRLSYPDRRYEEAASDIRDMIDFARRHAVEWGGDAGRLALVAYSGGGPMLSVPMMETMPYLRAMVNFYAFMATGHVDTVSGQISTLSRDRYSPVLNLRRGKSGMPPLLIVRAGQDRIPGLNASIDEFISEALRRDAALEVINCPGMDHGFDNKTDSPITRAAIQRSIEFLKFHLLK